MKIKVSETTGIQLDWLVTSIECPDELKYGVDDWMERRRSKVKSGEFVCRWHQSWCQSGPIIERERIGIHHAPSGWRSSPYIYDENYRRVCTGPTALVTALRCYVATKLGGEVDVPEELRDAFRQNIEDGTIEPGIPEA